MGKPPSVLFRVPFASCRRACAFSVPFSAISAPIALRVADSGPRRQDHHRDALSLTLPVPLGTLAGGHCSERGRGVRLPLPPQPREVGPSPSAPCTAQQGGAPPRRCPGRPRPSLVCLPCAPCPPTLCGHARRGGAPVGCRTRGEASVTVTRMARMTE